MYKCTRRINEKRINGALLYLENPSVLVINNSLVVISFDEKTPQNMWTVTIKQWHSEEWARGIYCLATDSLLAFAHTPSGVIFIKMGESEEWKGDVYILLSVI
ncbi:hypothetical protein AVEN_93854-1 [Araneus ventricosus]|uniref:Uncharacterized protein n=1 Tax=Araneus ventricosus TaxID=182803 RepID=A0A4Y2B0G3_ARAVE|nr:hypothetical protein AVEN_93854-1 [Araneus ventricosus]